MEYKGDTVYLCDIDVLDFEVIVAIVGIELVLPSRVPQLAMRCDRPLQTVNAKTTLPQSNVIYIRAANISTRLQPFKPFIHVGLELLFIPRYLSMDVAQFGSEDLVESKPAGEANNVALQAVAVAVR